MLENRVRIILAPISYPQKLVFPPAGSCVPNPYKRLKKTYSLFCTGIYEGV